MIHLVIESLDHCKDRREWFVDTEWLFDGESMTLIKAHGDIAIVQ